MAKGGSGWFQTYLLPGFAFKAVIIGGGYATGRELAEFFLPAGPWGGLAGMVMAMVLWSAIAAATFMYAQANHTLDYRSFFERLLGRGWIVYEIVYVLFVILILAVFGAAAGAIGAALFGLPPIVGTFTLMISIAGFATFGNEAVEQLFKYVSFFLYGTYAIFLVLALTKFGDRIFDNFSVAPGPSGDWALGGLAYAGYNVVGAVVVLPVIRHITNRRDAMLAGIIAGPLAMIPAILFFISMIAYYPEIANETLPSDFLLIRLDQPVFHVLFQCMIFSAVLESGTGGVHAINERIARAMKLRGKTLTPRLRLIISGVLLIGCMFIANRIGLVDLIAGGYRFFAWVILAVYVVPLATLGVWWLWRNGAGAPLDARIPAEQPATD